MFHVDKQQFKYRLEKIKTINLTRLTFRVLFFIVFCNAKPFNSSAKSTIIKIFETILKQMCNWEWHAHTPCKINNIYVHHDNN